MTLNIAMIGAGFSSAVFSWHMRKKVNCNLQIFEKSRGSGGRLSRHYTSNYSFDIGAQDLIIDSKNASPLIKHAIKQKALLAWQPTFRLDTANKNTRINFDDIACYCGNGSMNYFVKWLFDQTTIFYQTKIVELVKKNQSYFLISEKKEHFGPFDMVIFSCPTPQIQALSSVFDKELSQVHYSSCMVVNLGLSESLPVSTPHVIKHEKSIARWLIQTHLKPNASSNPGLTIQSKNLSFQELTDNKEQLLTNMIKQAQDILNTPLDIQYKHHHIWRYAKCNSPIANKYLFKSNLGIIGDCFNPKSSASNLEACIESAISLSHYIEKFL